jgi:hypothetical protein
MSEVKRRDEKNIKIKHKIRGKRGKALPNSVWS